MHEHDGNSSRGVGMQHEEAFALFAAGAPCLKCGIEIAATEPSESEIPERRALESKS